MDAERLDRERLQAFWRGQITAEEQAALAAYLDAHPEALADLADAAASADALLADRRRPPAAGGKEPAVQRRETESSGDEAAMPPAPPAKETLPGRVGPYLLLERLSRRGAGAVYQVSDDRSGRLAALKVLPLAGGSDPQVVPRFRREIERIGRLDHPHLVRFLEGGEADGVLYLAMELLVGLDLAALVERLGPLPVPAACSLARQTALALQHVHEHQLVHRDVKPSNIFLTEEGQVKLLDLGLARSLASADSLTDAGHLLDTLDYLAPEQAFDAHQADARSDVYSLGCTLYKLLAGSAPFSGPAYRHLLKKALAHASHPLAPIRRRPGVPVPLMRSIEMMCAKLPADRYQTPLAVARALAPFCKDTALVGLVGQARAAANPAAVPSRTPPVPSPAVPVPAARRPSSPVRGSPPDPRPSKGLPGWTVLAVLGLGYVLVRWVAPHLSTETPPALEEPAVALAALEEPAVALADVPKATSRVAVPTPLSGPTDARPTVPAHTGQSTGRPVEPSPAFPPAGSAEPVGEVCRISLHRETRGHVIRVAFSVDGKHLFAGINDGTLRCWSVETRKEVWRAGAERVGSNRPVEALAVSPDGQYVLAGGNPGFLEMYKASNGEFVRDFRGHTEKVWHLAFSPSGKKFVSTSWDRTLYLWETAGAKNAGLTLPESSIWCAEFADSTRVITSQVGIRLVDFSVHRVTRYEIAAPHKVHQGFVHALAVSHSKRQFVSGSQEGRLILWNLDTFSEITRVQAHNDWINALAISADGRLVVSSAGRWDGKNRGDDNSVCVWELGSLKRVTRFTGHGDCIRGVAISPDGKYAASGSYDKTIRIWRLP